MEKTIKLTGEFFEKPVSRVDSSSFISNLIEYMHMVRPIATNHNITKDIFIHKDLFKSDQVFLRINRIRKPLEPYYEGPYPVLEKSDNFFTLRIKNREVKISIDRLKPAYILGTLDQPASSGDPIIPASREDPIIPASREDPIIPASREDSIGPSSKPQPAKPKVRFELPKETRSGRRIKPPSSFSSFIFITMDRKKVCKKSSAKKKMMSIEFKREIIEKHEQGVRVFDLSRQYGRSTSMICSVLKRKESIKSVTPDKGLTIISKLRTSLHENMEKLLMVWVTEKQLQGDTLTQTIICEKARAIYGDLLKQTPQTSIDEASEESFKASLDWFENFKKRSGIHSVVRHGEAASSDMKAAEDYIKTFADLIKAQGYISQQVFNCDETGLFWKKMPNRTYITAEEKMMPCHKP
ncbi:hypothetical protein LAZ67_X001410 [Cordylochernes scorpioides]|uniref:HTH CENPB-type domain-containing protein n=1 Tax=Cordylochernes scorpioides TaxID=51811 RepID=A0ABY6LSP0_9ARAC|nr:hypothetical protein LAZ67_X001410 [Cordylochernes scorpioides]